MPADPRLQFLNQGIDPVVAREAQEFYSSVPDTSWMQARGWGQQPMNSGYPQGMYPQMDPYQQAQKTYEDTIIQGINGLDVSKPTFQQDLQKFYAGHQDPNVHTYQRVKDAATSAVATHKELQSLFQRKPKYAETYANLIKGGSNTEDALSQLRNQGARDEENENTMIKLASVGYPMDNIKDIQDEHGNIDRVKAATKLYELQNNNPFNRKDLSAGEEKRLEEAAEEYHNSQSYSPDDKEKKAIMAKNKGMSWEQADAVLRQQAVESAQRKYQRAVMIMHSSGRSVSPFYFQEAGLPVPELEFDKRGKGRMSGGEPMGPPAPTGKTSRAVIDPSKVTPVSNPQQDALADKAYNNAPMSFEDKVKVAAYNQNNEAIRAQEKIESDRQRGITEQQALDPFKKKIMDQLTPQDLMVDVNDKAAIEAIARRVGGMNPRGKSFGPFGGGASKPSQSTIQTVLDILNDPKVNNLRDQLQGKAVVAPSRIVSVTPIK